MEALKEEPADFLYRGPLIRGNSNVRRGKKIVPAMNAAEGTEILLGCADTTAWAP